MLHDNMKTLSIRNNKIKKILVVGPLYDNTNKLKNIKNYINQYDLIVLNGNISFPFNNFDFKNRIKLIDELLATNKIIYNIGNLDYKISLDEECVAEWLKDKPNVINLNFDRGANIIITNGGISDTIKNLYNNLEASFVNLINNKPWHELYDGRFGRVISNLPLDDSPSFYNYSARIGTKYSANNTKVYAQEVSSKGLLNTIEV